MNFTELRKSLITEAQNSPMLLSDLAGLEAYVSESYNSRSFIELLQNADDAGATSFYVKRVKDYIIVANNGRPFNIKDLESLCRSASSNKLRGTSIGYRGIGFKSVVGFAKEIHLFSGDFEITFSKDLSKQLIPQAPKVPLIRIPHPIEQTIKQELSKEISQVQSKGYQTAFVFSDVAANQIDEEYTNFASTTLLFLNNIRTIQVFLDNSVTANISVLNEDKRGRLLKISTTNDISNWLVCPGDKCCIAFSVKENKISRLAKNEAIIHAFLPTEDSCGLGVIINGDFSTDPSRRHLIFDNDTRGVIENLVKLYASLLKNALSSSEGEMINSLMPYFDVKLIQLAKQSFEKDFIQSLKKELGPYFSKIKLAPSWFNTNDYATMMTAIGLPSISDECSKISHLNELVNYLGSKYDDLDNIIDNIRTTDISISGYAEIAVAGFNRILMNQDIRNFTSTPFFIADNRLCSLKDINDGNKVIDESFVDLMLDGGITMKDIGLCLKNLGLTKLMKKQFIDKEKKSKKVNVPSPQSSVVDWFNNASDSPLPVSSVGVQRWRSAEENTRNALNANGFALQDVSKKNVGYDLEGKDPNGDDIYIEVKSVEYAGQKFRMTNNEFAEAQYKQGSYYVAIVHQTPQALEISLVKNPIKNLNMTRQCVQWVWECSDYEFKPLTFEL